MKITAGLLAPLALSLSVAAMAEPAGNASDEPTHMSPPSLTAEAASLQESNATPGTTSRWHVFDAKYRVPETHQVRIEQRVIVRIAPQNPSPRQSLMADLPNRPLPPRLVERRMENCVEVAKIAGVQTTRDDRLLLFLRDRRLVSANLEKSCRARDFYSGFYVEPSKDGQICIKRDKLLSRTGANCEIDRMRQLVAADED